jgi:hypothetical protein
MTLKYTFIYINVTPGFGAEGFSESWFSGETGITPQSAINAREYLNLRLAFSGLQTFCTHIRISTLGSPRQVQVISLGNVPAAQRQGGGRLGGDKNLDSDFTDTAFLVRKTSTVPPSFGFTYLRGIDDDFVEKGGAYTPSAAMNTAFNLWVAKVVALTWGWYGVSGLQPAPQNVGAITVLASGQIQIVLGAALFLIGDVGKNKLCTVSGVQGAKTANGTYIFRVLDPVTAVSLKPRAILPYTVGGKMVFRNRAYIPMTSGSIDRVVSRKAGRPLYQSAGRKKTLVRG